MKKLILLLCSLFLLLGCATDTSLPPTVTPTPSVDENGSLKIYNNKPSSYTVDPYVGFAPSFVLNVASGKANHNSTYDTHVIEVMDGTSDANSILFTQNGLYLAANSTYTVSFNIASSINKNINVRVIDGDNQKTLYSKAYPVSDNKIEFSFNTANEISYTGYIEISLGGEDLNDYRIELSNLLVRPTKMNTSVKVNQVGYLSTQKKYAIFSFYDGDFFDVFDSSTNKMVYRGTIVNKKNDDNSKEIMGYGDFSDLSADGSYYIVSQFGSKSYNFDISSTSYQNLLKDSLFMISSQRCGYDLPKEIYNDLAHEACHLGYVNAYGYEHQIEANGGWHDAGDYGRYTSTTAKTTIDLLMSYLVSRESFSDEMGILESNNGVNDLLDEVKVGVNFLLGLQRNDGGIYHKVVSKQFANFLSPELDKEQQFALNVDTTSTAFSGAIFAITSRLVKDVDPALSERCQKAALLSYEFIQNNGYIDAVNPDEFGSGIYRDSEDISERYLFHFAMWYMTKDENYLAEAWKIENNTPISNYDLNYNNPAMYGLFLYAYTAEPSKKQIEAASTVISYADLHYVNLINDPYFISLGSNYSWGSNYVAANNAMMMLMGYSLNKDYKYVEASYDTLHYFLGRNALNQSYITNEGDQYPKNIHHRFTITQKVQLPGALVGGPNAFRNDPITQREFNDETPRAKSYIDHQDSYSTNEVAIYYNSPLVFVLATLDSIQNK